MGNVNRRTAIKRRNFKKNNDVKKMKKAFSSKIQKLGPGKKYLNIDKEVVGQNGAIGLTLNEIISGREFATTLDNFNLIKVKSIQIVGFPNDNANNKPTYINLDCFGDINSDNIGQSERTKIMYNDTKRPVFFNFRLPGVMKNGQKVNSWIPREFFLDIMNLMSLKVITSDSNEEVRLRVVIRCEFRVPRITAATNRIEVRHTGTDLNKLCEVQYQKRFQKEDLEKIFVKKEKTPKLKKEEEELNLLNKMDLEVAASSENLEEKLSEVNNSNLSEVQEQGKNKKKNRKKKDKKKEKKENKEKEKENTSGLRSDSSRKVDFHSLFKKERKMVKNEQLKKPDIEEPSCEEKELLDEFKKNYDRVADKNVPFQYIYFESNIFEWRQHDDEVDEIFDKNGDVNPNYEEFREKVLKDLKKLAAKRGYSNIF